MTATRPIITRDPDKVDAVMAKDETIRPFIASVGEKFINEFGDYLKLFKLQYAEDTHGPFLVLIPVLVIKTQLEEYAVTERYKKLSSAWTTDGLLHKSVAIDVCFAMDFSDAGVV